MPRCGCRSPSWAFGIWSVKVWAGKNSARRWPSPKPPRLTTKMNRYRPNSFLFLLNRRKKSAFKAAQLRDFYEDCGNWWGCGRSFGRLRSGQSRLRCDHFWSGPVYRRFSGRVQIGAVELASGTVLSSLVWNRWWYSQPHRWDWSGR